MTSPGDFDGENIYEAPEAYQASLLFVLAVS